MRLAEGQCPGCGKILRRNGSSRVIGVQYSYDSKHHYDGVSEYECPSCSLREGRWSGRVLRAGEFEPRYGGKA